MSYVIRHRESGELLAARPVFGVPIAWTKDVAEAFPYETRKDAACDARFAWPSDWDKLVRVQEHGFKEILRAAQRRLIDTRSRADIYASAQLARSDLRPPRHRARGVGRSS